MQDKLTWRSKISFGLGAFGKDLVYAIVSTYLMKYLTDVRLVDAAFVGILFAVARIWDAVNDTAMGYIVDNTRTRWGKFRPWIMIGTLLNAVVLILLYLNVDFTGVKYAVYIGFMYVLWGMTYTLMDIPYWSMVPALTDNENERNQISAIPRLFASFAWLLVGSAGLYIVKWLGDGDQIKGFAWFAFAISVIFVITSAITVFNTKERVIATAGTGEKTSIKKMMKVLFKNDQVLVVLAIALFFNLAYQLSNSFALYYFEYVCNVKETLFAVYTAVAGIAQIGALFLFPFLRIKINKTVLFVLACLFPVLGFALLFLAGYVAPESAVFVGFCSAIVNIGIGFMLVLVTVILSEVVDYGEYKFESRNESVLFSTQTFVVKFAGAFSALISGLGLKLIGFVANTSQSAKTVAGMRIIMIVIPAVFSLICLLIYLKKYKLKDKYYKKMMEELKEKRSAEDVSRPAYAGIADSVYAGDQPVNTQAEKDAYAHLTEETTNSDNAQNADERADEDKESR